MMNNGPSKDIKGKNKMDDQFSSSVEATKSPFCNGLVSVTPQQLDDQIRKLS